MKNSTDSSKSTCTIQYDGEIIVSDNYVAITDYGDGNMKILYETDAVSLGMAMKLCATAYLHELAKLPEETRAEIEAVLELTKQGE